MNKSMGNEFIAELVEQMNNKYSKRLGRRTASKAIKWMNKHNKMVYIRIAGGMLNEERAVNIYHLLSCVLRQKVPGDVVDVGCYGGLASILMQKTLDQFNSKKQLHVYDSFQGLPKECESDGECFKEGDLRISKENLIRNFKKFSTKLPKIHPGWFKDTLPTQLPKKICFAHLDGDFYTSITESLENVYPRLAKNAVVVIDDYCDPSVNKSWNELPGVKKACDDFFKDKPEKVSVLIAGVFSHGYFVKA